MIKITQNEKNKLKKFQDKYPLLLNLSKLSGVSSLELLMTVLDYKPAVADAINYTAELKRDISRIKDLAQQLGLFLATSKYKYIVNSPRGIFEEIPLNDMRLGKIILAFSKSQDKAQKGAIYYHIKMLNSKYGYKFGKLMGYPECCLQFGNYLNNDIGDPNNFGFKNPAVESLKRSKHFAWQLNVFTVSPIPHYPCSLTCKKSIAYVDKMFTYLDYIDKERSIFLKNYLTKPASLYWTCADRILLYGDFKQYTLGTGEIKYNKIEPIITSDTFYQEVNKKDIVQWRNMAKALQKGNKLIVTDYLCSIYLNKEKIFEVKKNNKYIPVLVKPDI
jgi:hypothetical protein